MKHSTPTVPSLKNYRQNIFPKNNRHTLLHKIFSLEKFCRFEWRLSLDVLYLVDSPWHSPFILFARLKGGTYTIESVCLFVIRYWNYSGICSRSRFLEGEKGTYQRGSSRIFLEWSLSRLLSSSSFEYRMPWLIRLGCLSVCGITVSKPQSISLFGRWFYFNGWKVVLLSVCFSSCVLA